MFKKSLYSILFLLLIASSLQNCEKGKNFCVLCELATDLCKQCESELFIPDENGGCKGSKKCYVNQNYCLECSSSSHLCSECDTGYFPDDNGGCSLVKNCDVSENGNCKKCIDGYALIYSGKNYMECISMDTEELLNCEEYDLYGHCNKCKEGFYLNAGDRKCSGTENCLKSTGGVCEICEFSFYLDKSNKTNLLCNPNFEKNKFLHCSISEDGENCDLCMQPYFLSGDKKCVRTKYCSRGVTGSEQCNRCDNNYYLSEDKYSCTVTQNCKSGYFDNGKCKLCFNGYYNNLDDGKCYSNTEDNIYKYCQTASEKCESCIKDYYLGEDKKCSSTKNCSESDLGICKKCVNNYYLGKLDNKCSEVQYCIKSDYKYDCEECEDNYFVSNNKCIKDDIQGETFKNCKIVFYNQEHCSQCKNNYYLNLEDNLCYNNEKNYYKCSKVSNNTCTECESLYYLGEDNKCSKIAGCALSETPDICTKCLSSLCKNNKKGTCEQSFYIDEEEKEDINNGVCFRCQETNQEGNKCIKCEEGYILSQNGFCMDYEHCDEIKDGVCVKCKQHVHKDGMVNSYCLNDKYGCVDAVDGCLQCNDMYAFNTCTKCFEGYYFDEYYGFCYECKNGCTSCTDHQNCGGCMDEGYYTIDEATTPETYDAVCEQCIEGCKKCSNNLDCESCYDGYYLTNDNPDGLMKCASCGLFCEECYDGEYCLKCIDGFELVTEDYKIVCQYKNSN
jgi:hypothetical protein